ncbi:adenylate/guanylate cyclase domain-containing protein [Ensifer sesbaniae]|uniref:adenylate/guanylate cyclase domain-containing protein n=1 Tax=Ensifer sesbaniae TaxID=1214071 RepID=UPI0015681D3B|nr:adenylate/guanylate cyclase domain-containing protein [Ensifer sesbaniae]NRQ15398.1 Adenylate cyclase [Ensifer sesbaniae]
MSWTKAVRSLLELGASNAAEGDREGILVANVAACVIVVTTTTFALIYALYGEPSLVPLVYANLALAAAAALTPFFHRFGRIASGLWEFGICIVILVWIASYVGRDSGVLLTLLGVTPVAFAILGFENIALVAVLSAAATITVIAASIAFPEARSGVYDANGFLQLLYSSSIVTLTLLSFATIYYAFHLAREAQGRLARLMASIMPDEIVARLLRNERETIIDEFEHATVVLTDIVQFVNLSNGLGPERTVSLLNELFGAFDRLAANLGVEKIKTIGDAYLAVAGVPRRHPAPEKAAAAFGFGAIAAAREIGERYGVVVTLRAGMASGSVTAGVLGRTKYAYDVWGAPVNLAARLEAVGKPDCITTTAEVRQRLNGHFQFVCSGHEDIKGFGPIEIWTMQSPSRDTSEVESRTPAET